MMESKLAIAWIDLKFSASSMIGQNPKPILNKINGFINFGSLNALMGPSGAGKSTLLKCINGRNTFGLGNGTQIYLNSVYEIRSCFIVQDIKEHLLTGLTASESLVYASKIKNSEEKVVVDHQKNAEKLLSDLMISDISKTVVDKCSGGEQKRLAIALELTANHKPNLLCIDEPTSGLDSNAAEIVIECLKEVSRKHQIAVVTSIHQPNSDVLMMFDQLYVLAKGGFCVFEGSPKELSLHLSECGIKCNENQIPIEVLLKIASVRDERVLKLANKESQKQRTLINRCITEGYLAPNGIKFKSKTFRFSNLWYLLLRSLTYTYRSQWKAMIIQFIFNVGLGFILTKMYNKNIGKPDGCFSFAINSSVSYVKTVEALREESLLTQNLKFNFFAGILLMFLQIVATTMTFSSEIKIFLNEHQNCWYSTGSYYWAKTIVELPLSILISFCFVWTIYKESGQIEDQQRFLAYLLMLTAGVLCSQGLGLLIGIISEANDKLAIVLSVGLYLYCVLFCGFFIPIEELPELIQWLANLSYAKQSFESMLISIYGFKRCPSGQLSSILYQFNLNDDHKFWINSLLLMFHFTYLRILALFVLIIKANPFSFTNKKWLRNRRKIKIKVMNA